MVKTGAGLSLLVWGMLALPLSLAAPPATHDIKLILEITGGGAGPLSLPSDVAVDEQQIYIVDGGNHRLMVFDHDGKYRFAVGGEGDGPGQFNGPLGIDAGSDGRIYVADRGNQRIQILSKQGEFLKSFKVKSSDGLVTPVDVAVDREGKEIYVTGNSNHKVMVFSREGKLQREWGGSGLDPGNFRYPGSLSFLPDQRLAVVDILNTRVQLFEPAGQFSIEVGAWGVLPGQLFRPKGVAVDGQGRIYVSDSYMNVVQVFSDTGNFQHLLHISGGGRKLESPAGIAIGSDQRLYVAEMLEHRVSVFALGQ